MRNTLNLCLALVVCAAGMQAQQSHWQADQSKNADSMPGPAFLEGCLEKPPGGYTLTGKDGVLHHLTDTSKLKTHVGHQVQLSGTPTTRSVDATLAGGASSVIERPVFRVNGVKDIAATCQAGPR